MPRIDIKNPGSIPNHKLLKNLQLQGNYISNDGGDEGISIQDDGDVIINGDTKLYLNDAGGEYLNSDGTDLTIASGNDCTINAEGDVILDANGADLLFADNGTNLLKFSNNAGDWTVLVNTNNKNLTFRTNSAGAATTVLTMVGSATGSYSEFFRAVGFDKETTTFAAAAVTSEGDDSTDIDFRLGNKHELGLTDNIGGSGENINMIFPATSGNFILVIYQDSTGDRTVAADGWVAYASDASLADNTLSANLTDGNVRWAGGSAPTLSTGSRAVDVISIYWDADTQTALAVASLNFATP